MALNPDRLEFFLRGIEGSDWKNFGSIVSHIFQHLDEEVKDNPIFDKYEKERENWKDWPNSGEGTYAGGEWYFPSDYNMGKSLSYDVYRTISENGERGYSLPVNVIRGSDIGDSIYKFNDIFLEYFELALDDIVKANPEIETEEIYRVEGDTVFIIHGHDEQLKTEVQLLLERAGVRNVVLHEQPDKGRTIIDKLVEESQKSNYAIALFSPDDKLDDGSNRARQNVILEVGYFMGKLGKERIRLLINGDIEIPSDLQGILYEKYDKKGAWKMKILKELQAIGIFVDFDNVLSKI